MATRAEPPPAEAVEPSTNSSVTTVKSQLPIDAEENRRVEGEVSPTAKPTLVPAAIPQPSEELAASDDPIEEAEDATGQQGRPQLDDDSDEGGP
jgi:hypothetical protein